MALFPYCSVIFTFYLTISIIQNKYQVELRQQRACNNLRWVIVRSQLQFYRRQLGPVDELEYPITKKDLCDKLWVRVLIVILLIDVKVIWTIYAGGPFCFCT